MARGGLPLESDLFNNFIEMEKEKAEWECSLWTFAGYEVICKAREKLEESEWKFKVVVHPSVISYDYRIAWTWEEMEKRNEYNWNVDHIRMAFWLNARPYGRPLYSQWTTHWGKDRPLQFNEWW